MKKLLLTALALALLFARAHSQETVAFKLLPPPGKLKLAETFTVRAEAALPLNYSLRPDTSSVDTGSFELLSFTQTGSEEKDGLKTVFFEIRAQAFALGVSTFPAITWNLYLSAPGTAGADGAEAQAKSPSFNIEVLPLFESKPDEDIRDIYPPLRFIAWWWLALAAAAAAGLLLLLYRKFGPKKGRAAFAADWKDSRTPFQRARERLNKFAACPLAGGGRLKEFYIGLTSILRLYLAEEFSIDASLMTTGDLARELKRTGTGLKTNLRAREFLQKADLVKFAKLQPNDAAADTEALKDLLLAFTQAAEKAKAPAEAAAPAETGPGALK